MLNNPGQIPYQSYRLLIALGETNGTTNFFAGMDLTSLIGRSLLIRNIKFIPRFLAGVIQHKEIQFLDETGAGNNMDLVSPNDVLSTPRIITANVEFRGIHLDFRINGQQIQIVDGATYYLNFDNEFKDINLYFPDKLNNLYLTAQEQIYTDVSTGALTNYLLQVNFDIIIEPSKELLTRLMVNR